MSVVMDIIEIKKGDIIQIKMNYTKYSEQDFINMGFIKINEFYNKLNEKIITWEKVV